MFILQLYKTFKIIISHQAYLFFSVYIYRVYENSIYKFQALKTTSKQRHYVSIMDCILPFVLIFRASSVTRCISFVQGYRKRPLVTLPLHFYLSIHSLTKIFALLCSITSSCLRYLVFKAKIQFS